MYLGVINCNLEYVAYASESYKSLNEYDIIQKCDDDRLERCIEVKVCEDDRVIIYVKDNPINMDFYIEGNSYEVTNDKAKKKFLEIYDEMLKREGVGEDGE